jgi:thiosulfate/3-mercaptopyruvate sulfurtransferase
MRLIHNRALIAIAISIVLSLGAGCASSQDGESRISPAELVKALQAPKEQQPLVIQIGFRVMYQQAHIPGSEFIGPADDLSAIQLLRERVQLLPRTAWIVLYCGCCPWERCPNIAPATKAMAAMGFTNVKVVYMPTDFGTDWVSKGYPVQSGG